jgi:hypothetical protein
MVEVATFCGNCGNAAAGVEERYCRKCGKALDLSPRATTPPTPTEASTASAPWRHEETDSVPPGYVQTSPIFRQQSTNGLAIASLVLGILWLYWLGSILALIFGYVARKQIDRSNEEQKGRGLATAGIVLGWVGVGVAIVALGVGVLVFAASHSNPAVTARQDAAAKSDLRNALTAEKTSYVDTQDYTASTATLAAIEPSLLWNAAGGPQVSVGDIVAGDSQLVCLQEASKSGATFSIADVATGASAGTYYNKGVCSGDVSVVTNWTGW